MCAEWPAARTEMQKREREKSRFSSLTHCADVRGKTTFSQVNLPHIHRAAGSPYVCPPGMNVTKIQLVKCTPGLHHTGRITVEVSRSVLVAAVAPTLHGQSGATASDSAG